MIRARHTQAMTHLSSPDLAAPSTPYGAWTSPISAEMLADAGHDVGSACFVGDDVWWAEQRPNENGRAAVRRLDRDGVAVDVLPAPWNARSRVHEYGGGAWTGTAAGVLVFVEFADQRLYRLDPGAEPVPLTAESAASAGAAPTVRFGELAVSADGREVWAVRETHTQGGVVRDLIAVPLDGSAAGDDTRVRSIVGGSDFLAGARRSPDGRRLAWIAWNHPQMPWDGTELRVAELGPDGTCGPFQVLLGSKTESVLQPEWADDDVLYALSDRSGWWNVHVVAADGTRSDEVAPVAADVGGPLWMLGRCWYLPLDDGQLLAVQTNGTDRLARLDPHTGSWSGVELDGLTAIELGSVRGRHLCVTAGGPQTPTAVRIVDLGAEESVASRGAVTDVRLGLDQWPDPAYLPQPELATFRGDQGQDVHAIVYPPANLHHVAPEGELAPYVAFVHGGPTSRFAPLLDLGVAYLTSRGIGVVQVNYGGSTGYGRDYRRRLNGEWGVVDVADTVSVVRGLVDAGRADPGRLAIQGGSSGGWTVLSALTQTDAFACGISYYGVTDLVSLAADTHDFESHYLDGLVGPLPEARGLYDQRAPANHLDGLSCPVLLLQGLDDPVVPPSQAERFRDALLTKGIPHAYRAYQGESHGFRRRQTIVDSTEAAMSFLGQVMGFTPTGVPVLELWRP